MVMWFLLLNKRLYKKITYIGILLLIPVFVAVFAVASKEPSGIVTVVLAKEDPQNALATQIIEELKSDTLVVSFQENTPEMAKELVAAGKADAAWIFPGDMQGRIKAYVKGERNSVGFIKIIEREQTVPLLLSREKLSSVVHKQVVRENYLKYIRSVAPETQEVSDDELLTFLGNTQVSGELFEFYDIDGNKRNENVNYLTAPIRGMLAILAVVCGMVTAMYYQADLDRGIFVLLPEKKRIFAEFGYQMISAINILLFICAALLISGLGTAFWKELLIFVLFAIGCSLFGMLLRMLFGGGRGMAVLLPLMTVLMFVVCPVFFDFASMRYVQYLLPPTYFVNCAYNKMYFLYIAIYDVVLFALCFGCDWMKTRLPKMNHLSVRKVRETV